jgi:hypothetical protein
MEYVRVAKVSLIVMLVAGATVRLIDRAGNGPPDAGSGEHAPHHAPHHPGAKHR